MLIKQNHLKGGFVSTSIVKPYIVSLSIITILQQVDTNNIRNSGGAIQIYIKATRWLLDGLSSAHRLLRWVDKLLKVLH